jgi:lysophospholipase L1-like esterase
MTFMKTVTKRHQWTMLAACATFFMPAVFGQTTPPRTSTSAASPAKDSPAKPPATKPAAAKTAVKKIPTKKKYQPPAVTPVRRRVPQTPPVSPATRAEAAEGVSEKIITGATIPVENPAALVPFFEQLYRHQNGELAGPLKVLQYGDSHTAADEWTGDLRGHFQEMFGDGGSGYALAGSPYRGYRRFDLRSGATRGWKAEGVIGHFGDGIHGLGGISISTNAARESVYLSVECQTFELYYWQQPGGGSLQIFDNGNPIDQISTDGDFAPGYYRYETEPGPHRFEVETLDRAPVRLFGWVTEKATGVTYESLGINGVSASVILDWNVDVLTSNLRRRNPALIVLAYGTNEASRKDWTIESYRDVYIQLIRRLRQAAPTATILVVGPPDRYIHTRKGWTVLDNVETIVEGQRQAAFSEGCAFWDLRAKMGGSGSMRQWVQAGMGQLDYVHFTAPGYRKIGDAVFRDLMSQYDIFVKAREALAKTGAVGSPGGSH